MAFHPADRSTGGSLRDSVQRYRVPSVTQGRDCIPPSLASGGWLKRPLVHRSSSPCRWYQRPLLSSEVEAIRVGTETITSESRSGSLTPRPSRKVYPRELPCRSNRPPSIKRGKGADVFHKYLMHRSSIPWPYRYRSIHTFEQSLLLMAGRRCGAIAPGRWPSGRTQAGHGRMDQGDADCPT